MNGPIDDYKIMKMRTYQSYGHSVGLHDAKHIRATPFVAEKGLERLAVRDEVLTLSSHDIMAKSDGKSRHKTSLDVLERILAKARALGVEVIGFDEIGTFVYAGGKPAP